jgi:hypothetical protein
VLGPEIEQLLFRLIALLLFPLIGFEDKILMGVIERSLKTASVSKVPLDIP